MTKFLCLFLALWMFLCNLRILYKYNTPYTHSMHRNIFGWYYVVCFINIVYCCNMCTSCDSITFFFVAYFTQNGSYLLTNDFIVAPTTKSIRFRIFSVNNSISLILCVWIFFSTYRFMDTMAESGIFDRLVHFFVINEGKRFILFIQSLYIFQLYFKHYFFSITKSLSF